MSNSTFYGRNNSKFGTYQAKQIERSTSDNSFFEAGHKIVLGNELELDSNTSVSDLINNERESILSDPDLRVIFERIDKKLVANNQLRDFRNFLEVYPELLTKILAYEDFQKENVRSIISCFKYGWMNPWWAYKSDLDKPDMLFPESVKRSQDLESLYCPTGAVWFSDREKLEKENTFYSQNYKLFEMSWKVSVDIDDYEDLDFAKAVYMLRDIE